MVLPWWSAAAAFGSFSAGVIIGQLVRPAFLLGLAALAAGAYLVIIRRDLAALMALSLAALSLGLARGVTAPLPALPAQLIDQSVLISGQVDDDPVDRKTNHRISVHVDQLLLNGAAVPPAGLRVQATYYGMTPVHYGDLVLLIGVIQPPAVFEQFDYRAYLAEQGIAAVKPSARLVRSMNHGGDPFHTLLFALRHGVIATVDRTLPEPQAALVLGVVFGYRAALPPTLQQAMIASGLIHIVVISGLKVSLLARIVSGALGHWLPRAAPWLAASAMAGYALLAGASAAALRAAAMGALVVLAGRLRRDSHVAVSMALTAAVMLALKPALAGDVSFQLSFAGTMGIAAMTDPIAARLRWTPHVFRDPFAATIAAETATWPLMLANFHQVSLIGPLANALVLPVLPALMVLGGLGTMVGAVGQGLAWAPMQLAGLVASWFRLVIESLGSLPVAALVAPYFPTRWLLAASVVNGGVLLGIKLRQFFSQQRAWAALGIAGLVAAVLLLIRPDGRVPFYALDIGTGSAVLIRTAGGHQLLIDGGPDGDRFAQAIGRALPPTARTIDLWLITSGRRPNIGGAAAVLNRFQVQSLAVVTADAWSVSLRALVQQAQASVVPVTTASGPFVVDGVTLSPAGDGLSWLIQTATGRIAVIDPQTAWLSAPADVQGVIFDDGGPTDWQGPGRGFSVIEVDRNSRDGLPTRALTQALAGAPVYPTDRLGTIELAPVDGRFQRV